MARDSLLTTSSSEKPLTLPQIGRKDVLNTYFLIQRRLEGNDYVIADQEAYDRHVNTATSYERTETTKLVQKLTLLEAICITLS